MPRRVKTLPTLPLFLRNPGNQGTVKTWVTVELAESVAQHYPDSKVVLYGRRFAIRLPTKVKVNEQQQ